MELLQDFIYAMRQAGYGPADSGTIRADNKRHDFRLDRDPPNKKKGYYRLKIEGDFGFGYFGDYRNGDEPQKWSSKVARHYTDQERREFAEKMRLQEEEDRKEELERHTACAKEAREFIAGLAQAQSHPYTERKGVGCHGALVYKTSLILPMMDKNGIWNYQEIQPDGTKLFFGGKKGARKTGTWFVIPGSGGVGIAEGFATGASCHEATGWTVYVAWDAGNLPHIAPQVREMHPDDQIYIFADNDHEKPKNAGITAGTKAASLIGGILSFPEFVEWDASGNTDFNDYARLYGLEKTRNRILEGAKIPLEEAGEVVSSSPAVENLQHLPGDFIPDPNWQDQLIRNDKGVLVATSIHNAICYLQNDYALAGVFRFNEFKSDIFLTRCPPWDDPSGFTVRRVENVDLTRAEAFLEQYCGLKIGATRITSAIEAAADRNRFHPVRDYFDSLTWDGVPRVKNLLRYYACAEKQPADYLERISTIWMCAAVARVRNPGCKFDHMLVLEGPQNAGKSMFLRTIGTFGTDIEECHYTDAVNISAIEDRGSILKLQGHLIVEFPEMAGLGKKDQDELKRWVTLQCDEVEVKHKQRTQVLPRQYVLAGTYNPIAGMGWINDPTGGRRFWPVGVGNKVRLEELKRDREQLWAEAVHIHEGVKLFIDEKDPVYEVLQNEQKDRADFDLWHDEIRKITQERDIWTTAEVLEKLGIPIGKQNNKTDKSRVSKVFMQLGWEYKTVSIAGLKIKHWCSPEKKQMSLTDEEEIKW